MPELSEEWADAIVRLNAVAYSLETEGYYNVAKLARAAADSLCRRAAHAAPISAQASMLVDELAALSNRLTALGLDAGLIQALERGREALSNGLLPMFDQPGDPHVCRSCGHMVVGQPGYRCAGCGAPADTLQTFRPIYWLTALDPFSALNRLRQTPMDVAGLVAARVGRRSDPPVIEQGWDLKEALSHLLDADQLLNIRIRRMLAEDDPSLEALAVSEWADDVSRHPTRLEEVLREYQQSREATLMMLEGIPLADWWRTGRHAEFGPVTIGQQASYFALHEITHLPQIARVR
jgi:hypothetical protein